MVRFILSAWFGGLLLNLAYALYERSFDKSAATVVLGVVLAIVTVNVFMEGGLD